jgi:hypothetical protein
MAQTSTTSNWPHSAGSTGGTTSGSSPRSATSHQSNTNTTGRPHNTPSKLTNTTPTKASSHNHEVSTRPGAHHALITVMRLTTPAPIRGASHQTPRQTWWRRTADPRLLGDTRSEQIVRSRSPLRADWATSSSTEWLRVIPVIGRGYSGNPRMADVEPACRRQRRTRSNQQQERLRSPV